MSVGDMVVRIVGDNSQFDNSVDKSESKFRSMAESIAKGSTDLAKSLKNLDGETALWGNSTDILKQKQAALKTEMSRLISEGIDPTGKETQKLMNDYYKLGNEIIALEKKQVSLTKKMTDWSMQAGKIGKSLSLFVTAPLLGLGVAAVKSAADMEMLEASFTTMLGSAEKAKVLMEDIKDLAAVTPFEASGLAASTKVLLQFGVSGKEVINVLKRIGDVSGGNQARMNSLALVYGQVQSAGKLMGQDLLQLINAGFNPLKEISDRTGESMASLKDKMSKGAISSDMVAESFKFVTSEGGLFFKGMETASKTLSGLMSTLSDDVSSTGRSFVEDLMPAIKNTVKGVSELAKWIGNLDSNTKQNILIIAGFTAILGPAIIGVSNLTRAVIALQAGLVINPIVAATTAVIALAAAFALVANNIRIAQENQKELNAVLKGGTTGNIADDFKIINDRIEEVNASIGASTGLFEHENAELEKELVLLKQVRTDLVEKNRNQMQNARGNAVISAANSEKELLAAKKKLDDEKKALETTEKYKDIRKEVLGILEDEKTEFQKIAEQINILSKTPWAKGSKLEADRLAAIEALTQKLKDANAEQLEDSIAIHDSEQKAINDEVDTAIGAIDKRDAAREKSRLGTISAENQMAAYKLKRVNDEKNLDDSLLAYKKENMEKEKNARLSLANNIISITSNMVNHIGNLINGETEDMGRNLALMGADIAMLFGQEGAVVSGIIQVGVQIFDIFDASAKKAKEAAKKIASDIKAILKVTEDTKLKILEQEITNLKSGLDDKIDLIDEEERLVLELAGFKEETDQERIANNIADLRKQLSTTFDLEERARIQGLIAEEEDALARQIIIDRYEKLRATAIEETNAKILASEKALADARTRIEIAELRVDMAKAPASARGVYMDLINLLNESLSEPENLDPYTKAVDTLHLSGMEPLKSVGTRLNVSAINESAGVSASKRSTGISADSGEGMINLTVQIDSEPILSKIFPATKNRSILISAGAVV